MKKVLSILLAMILILSIPVSTMALKSKGGMEFYQVQISRPTADSNAAKPQTEIVAKGDTIKVVPVRPSNKHTFNGFSVFADAAATVPAVIGKDVEVVSVVFTSGEKAGQKAVEGTDYKINKAAGTVIALNDGLLSVDFKPLVDNLYIREDYKDENGKDVVAKFEEIVKPDNTVSPETGESYNTAVIVALCLMILGVGFVAVSSKRSFN